MSTCRTMQALCGLSAIINLSAWSHGTVLLSWDIYSASNYNSSIDGSYLYVNATGVDSHVLPSTLTRGAGVSISKEGDYVAWEKGPGLFNTAAGWSLTSATEAISRKRYIEFTLAPAEGFALQLTTLNISLYQQSANSNATVFVMYSLDQFATSGTALPAVTGITRNETGVLTPFDLSEQSALQNVTDTVTFRIYGYGFIWNADGGIGRQSGSNTDMSLIGEFQALAVPELTSAGYLTIGALFLARFGRRRASGHG